MLHETAELELGHGLLVGTSAHGCVAVVGSRLAARKMAAAGDEGGRERESVNKDFEQRKKGNE